MFRFAPLISLALASATFAQTYSATYLPNTAPKTSEAGQAGTNQCGDGQDQNSMCQNVYVNSLDDWCIFAPPQPGPGSVIGNTERFEVSWCVQGGHGTRVIPDGAITGAHFVQTPDYVQVTGVGDLTKVNIPAGDEGGELDPHGADGNGNPIGGLVFSNAFGSTAQMHEWTNFVAYNEFCIRACKDGPNAPRLCEHIYDVLGCDWNMPGDYSAGSFDSCQGDTGEPMGVYGSSTFYQGEPSTPAAHPAPSKSECQKVSTIGNGLQITTPAATTAVTTASSSSAVSASVTTTSSGGTASATSTTAVSAPSTTSSTGTASGMSTTRSSVPPAPTTNTGSASGTSSGTSGTPAPTGAANNGAASFFGRGMEIMVAGTAVVICAVLVA